MRVAEPLLLQALLKLPLPCELAQSAQLGVPPVASLQLKVPCLALRAPASAADEGTLTGRADRTLMGSGSARLVVAAAADLALMWRAAGCRAAVSGTG